MLQALDVALNLFRLSEGKSQLRFVPGQIDGSESAQRARRDVRRLEQLVAARGVLSAPTRQIDVVLRLGPGSLQLGPHVSSARNDEQCVRWEERANGGAFGLRITDGDLSIHRQHQRDFGVTRGALTQKIEVAQLGYIVVPEFEPHRLRHPEAVNVENAAADAELRDIFDHWHTFEANGLEVRGQLLWPAPISLAQLEPCRCQRTGKLCPFECKRAT